MDRRLSNLPLLVTALLLLFAGAACARHGDQRLPARQPSLQSGVCSLSAAGSATGGEWGSCIQVTTRLSRPPAVGETAQLTVDVLAVKDYQARVEIDLPRTVTVVTPPAGLTPADVPTADPEADGCLHRATGTVTLQTLQTLRLNVVIRATAAGFVSLRARAVIVPATSGGTGADLVPLTVGDAPGESFIGYGAKQPGAVTDAVPRRPTCDPA